MRIGQIVFIDKNFGGPVQTGIINRKEKCQTGEFWWYEVLCNDGQNHVLPEYLLSPARTRMGRDHKASAKNLANSVHACIKRAHT